MSLEVSWDGLWTLSFGLSQFHGLDSWVVCEVALRTTSHTRLKARDHCSLKYVIGQKGQLRPSSLYIRRWGSKHPKKLTLMKNLHGLLQGILWMIFHVLLEISSCSLQRGRSNANSHIPRWSTNWYGLWMRAKALTMTWSRPLAHMWSGPFKVEREWLVWDLQHIAILY